MGTLGGLGGTGLGVWCYGGTGGTGRDRDGCIGICLDWRHWSGALGALGGPGLWVLGLWGDWGDWEVLGCGAG